jgi:hypothetical protein
MYKIDMKKINGENCNESRTYNHCDCRERERERESYTLKDSVSKANIVCNAINNKKLYVV